MEFGTSITPLRSRFRGEGFNCEYLPLGYLSDFKTFQEIKELPEHYGTCSLGEKIRKNTYLHKHFVDRPIDVLFLGTLSARRENFLRTPPVCYRIIIVIYIFLKRKAHCCQDSTHLWTLPLPWGWRRCQRFFLTFIVALIGILNGTAL